MERGGAGVGIGREPGVGIVAMLDAARSRRYRFDTAAVTQDGLLTQIAIVRAAVQAIAEVNAVVAQMGDQSSRCEQSRDIPMHRCRR